MDRLTALGLEVRPPTRDDAQPIFELISAVDTFDFGAVDMTVEDVRAEMAQTDLEADAWLVWHDGTPVAFAALQLRAGVQHRGQVSVHPEWREQGIGSALAGALEERATAKLPQAPARAEVTLVGWVKSGSPALGWARGLGFAWARRFLRMRIDMTAAPPPASWPPGIAVRTFVPGRDERATHAALEEAFADHWGHVHTPFEEWVTRTQRPDFDPGLWFLAVDGGRVVATATNSVIPDNLGWISGLGVVPSHRRRGLARAILLHSFAEYRRRGMTGVALGVDADSLTGATRLYESVGMTVEEAYDQVRKVLRDGIPQETA
ncbi:MAG: GNAT family N-acetyltransferase [Candidatus Limnocylindria bacterium]